MTRCYQGSEKEPADREEADTADARGPNAESTTSARALHFVNVYSKCDDEALSLSHGIISIGWGMSPCQRRPDDCERPSFEGQAQCTRHTQYYYGPRIHQAVKNYSPVAPQTLRYNFVFTPLQVKTLHRAPHVTLEIFIVDGKLQCRLSSSCKSISRSVSYERRAATDGVHSIYIQVHRSEGTDALKDKGVWKQALKADNPQALASGRSDTSQDVCVQDNMMLFITETCCTFAVCACNTSVENPLSRSPTRDLLAMAFLL